MKIAGAILAAGASTRLGRPKQLLVIDGETLLARTIRIALGCAMIRELAVVLGAHKIELPSTVVMIDNPDFEQGMGTSVRKAAEWASTTNADGLLVMVCDQARLSTAHLDDLVGAFRGGDGDVGSQFGGSIGVPAIFRRARFADLMKLEGDRGAKSLLKGACFVHWPDGLVDLDTEADVRDFDAKNPSYS